MKEAMEMEDIYRRHAQTVYKFLLAQCRDADLAEELTAETFYQASVVPASAQNQAAERNADRGHYASRSLGGG